MLVHGFEEWGEALLPRLRGMFAFAIWNVEEQTLFLARDYFGIKPLHYTLLPDGRLLLRLRNQKPAGPSRFCPGIQLTAPWINYLSFQYSVPRETFFKNVYCLPPAHYLWFRDGQVTEHRYWEPRFEPDEGMTLDQAVESIDNAFTDSVEAHRISDVEVGCFLSGGVDSSFVATYFGGQKAFTVGFDNGEPLQRSASMPPSWRRRSVSIIIPTSSARRSTGPPCLMSSTTWTSRWPTPPASALYFVSKLAAEHVKVVLSGEGCGRAVRRLPHLSRTHLPGRVSEAAPLSPPGGCGGGIAALPFDFQGQILPHPRLQDAGGALHRQCVHVQSKKEKSRSAQRTIPATDPREQTAEYYRRCAGHGRCHPDAVPGYQPLDGGGHPAQGGPHEHGPFPGAARPLSGQGGFRRGVADPCPAPGGRRNHQIRHAPGGQTPFARGVHFPSQAGLPRAGARCGCGRNPITTG